MRKIATIIFIYLAVISNIYSDDIVNIWADNSAEDLGASRDRVWLKSYFLSNFEYYSTLQSESPNGELTVVTASRELYFLLDDLLKFDESYTHGDVTISKNDGIYTFIKKSISLDISFSLEKPGVEVFDIINSIYEKDPKTRKEVIDHYLESWVIRIYRAENVISPDINTIYYDDILITASIIGENFQWLWGVHDGVDYVYKSLTD